MKNPSFWNTQATQILQELQTTPQGLSNAEAARRLAVYGANRIKPKKKSATMALLMGQLRSPLILILIFAAFLSIFLHDRTDALIILTILIPFSPLAAVFKFTSLPVEYLLVLGAIVILYIIAAELAKALFYRRLKVQQDQRNG